MNLKIAEYFKIPLYFNILTLPFALIIYNIKEDLGAFAVATYIMGLFFVILHEFGHCFAARKFKWPVYDITILPIGGIAQINFKHNSPKQEILVALAGPAVSFMLFCLFFTLAIVAALYENFGLFRVFMVCTLSNCLIVAFNLLPFFPMDGGRVLRAVLSYKLGHLRATWWAVRIGQVGGLTLAYFAFTYGFILAGIILILVAVLSQNELAHARLVHLLHKMRNEMCQNLGKPELANADLPELIEALEAVDSVELKEKLKRDDMLALLKDLRQSRVII